MKAIAVIVAYLLVLSLGVGAQPASNRKNSRAVYLSDLTWQQAEKVLTPETIVVIPLGAAAKAHGPHLPLSADFVQAEFWKDRVAERFNVVIAPTVNYGFYPPFIEYPGSTTLGLSNAKGMIADICRSLARFGVRRFYVVNQGVSTNAALDPASAELRESGILLKFTDLPSLYERSKDILQQEKGTHADEVETSLMLHIAPKLVDLRKADKDYGQQKGSGIWPTRNEKPVNPLYTIYNPSGTYGDASIATKEKGKLIADRMISMISRDLEDLVCAELPAVRPGAERFGKFVGKYEIAPNDAVIVALEGESLIAQRTGKTKMVLLNAGPGKFELGRTELSFLRDGTGRVTHLLYNGDGISVLARKVD